MKLGTQVPWTLPFMLIKKFLNFVSFLKFSKVLNFADGFVISSRRCLQLGARILATKKKVC